MKTVQLIVTGELEKLALHQSFRPFFPEVQFLDALRLDGFTSQRLTQAAPPPTGSRRSEPAVRNLARAMVASVEPGRREVVPDLVLVIEDLELSNADQPERVTTHFLQAMKSVLQDHAWPSERTRQRAEERLRERCSFHLLAPMVEAYFFGDAQALVRAGTKRPCRFQSHLHDVEQFSVEDPDFQTPADGARHWAVPSRERHPKHYMKFLCTDPNDSEDTVGYRETRQGKEALRLLDWHGVLSNPRFASFARSLLNDLAEGLGQAPLVPGDESQLTTRKSDGTLRNL